VIALSTSADRVDWYENPTWKRRPVARTPKNIDLAVRELDGRPAIAVGTGFNFSDSARGGQIYLLRHVDGRTHDEVVEYLVTLGRRTPARAEASMGFIEHPLWRTYIFVYREGEELLRRWLEQVPEPERPARFARLLAEARSPSSIEAEIAEP
jgi:hypothetical protein